MNELQSLIRAWLSVAAVAVVLIAMLRFVTPRGWPPQRRRAVAWMGAHVAAACAVFMLMPGLILPLIPPEPLARWLYGYDVPPPIPNTLAMALANSLALPLLILTWRGLLSMTESEALPVLSWQRALRESRLGLQTWLWLTPLVFLTNLATMEVYTRLIGRPAEHPLLKPFSAGPPPASVVVLLMTSAVLAAPICEELLFRGIILRWLAARPWGGPTGLLIAGIVGVMKKSPPDMRFHDWAHVADALSPALLVIALVPVERSIPFWPGMRWLVPIADEATRRNALRAIVSSAAIFANAHASVWPSPIPLTVLAFGLGWLAIRTQGLIGPIVVHMFFNAVAFTFELAFK